MKDQALAWQQRRQAQGSCKFSLMIIPWFCMTTNLVVDRPRCAKTSYPSTPNVQHPQKTTTDPSLWMAIMRDQKNDTETNNMIVQSMATKKKKTQSKKPPRRTMATAEGPHSNNDTPRSLNKLRHQRKQRFFFLSQRFVARRHRRCRALLWETDERFETHPSSKAQKGTPPRQKNETHNALCGKSTH